MPRITGYKPCLNCGKPAAVRQNRWERTKFCSYKCVGEYNGKKTGATSAAQARARRPAIDQPMSYRLVPLTRGGVVKVDIEDYDFAMSFNWCLTDKGYARRTTRVAGRKANERLHRLIAERMLGEEIPITTQVDHDNGDRLDCRRSNLRPATHNQNSFNTRRVNKLNYRGVYRNHKRFYSKIVAYKTSFYIGTYDTLEEAAWMHDVWAVQLHGEFAVLNFDYSEVPRQ